MRERWARMSRKAKAWTIGIGAVVVIGAFGAASDDGDDGQPAQPTSAPTVEAEAPATPEVEAEPEAPETETPEATGPSVAEQVTQEIFFLFDVDSFQGINPEAPGFLFTGIEDEGAGTVRVHVQEPLTDDERDEFARWVANLACSSVPDLSTIIINDTSGIDSNHYLRSMTLPNTCA